MSSSFPYSGARPARAAEAMPGASGASASSEAFARMKQGAREAFEQMADRTSAAAERAGARGIRESIDQASEAVRMHADTMRASNEAWLDALREAVREHPLTAVAVAAALGIVLGRLHD